MQRIVLFLVVLTGMVFSWSLSHAAGFGPHLQLSGGEGTIEENDLWYESDLDHEAAGGGFSIISSPYGPRTFSNRVDIGFEAVNLDIKDVEDGKGAGIYVTNTFCFGIYKTKNVKFYLGPQIKAGIYSIDEEEFEANYALIGVGGVVGLNKKVSTSFGFGINGGIRVNSITGNSEIYGYSDDLEGSFADVFVNLAFIFGS